MDKVLHVLILEDCEIDLEIIKRELLKSKKQIKFYHAKDKQGFLSVLAEKNIDIVLCDSSLKEYSASEALLTVKSEESYRTIVNRVSDPFISINDSYRLTYINKLAEEMFGKSADLMLGQFIYHVLPISNDADLDASLQKAYLTKKNIYYESFSPFFGKWIGYNFYPSDSGCTILFKDLSKLKEIELDLQKSKRIIEFSSHVTESILRAKTIDEILENTIKISIEIGKLSVALISNYNNNIDVNGTFKWAVEENGCLNGYENHIYTAKQRDDLQTIHETFLKIKYFVSNDIEQDLQLINWKDDILKRGLRSALSLPIVVDNDLIGIIILYSKELNFFNDEEIEHLCHMINNISFGINAICVADKKKDLEAMQNLLTTDLVRRNIDLENFSYILSHNIRGPLSNILGLNEVLINENTEGNTRIYIDLVAQSTRYLDTVVKDISKVLQTKKIVFEEKEKIDFNYLIIEITNEYDELIREKSATINSDFSAYTEFRSVKSYIKSIFVELILNAVKFSQKGIAPSIFILTEIADKTLKIYFKDFGVGIDIKRYQSSLFGFYKKFSYNTEGKGLGLYLVKTKVEILHGQIEVKSELDQWTEFIISLPIVNEYT